MTDTNPSYWFQWIAGIAATVISSVLITRCVTSPPETLEFRTFDGYGRAFRFVYPSILGPVEPITSELYIGARVKNTDDFGFFNALFVGFKYGSITLMAGPGEYLRLPSSSDSASSTSTASAEDPFESAPLVDVRVGLDKGEPFITQKETEEGMVQLSMFLFDQGTYLWALGRFTNVFWEEYGPQIRESFGKFELNGEILKDEFRKTGWQDITLTTDQNNRRVVACSTGIWNPLRLEKLECSEPKQYENIPVREFNCEHQSNFPLVRIAATKADCESLQARIDAKSKATNSNSMQIQQLKQNPQGH